MKAIILAGGYAKRLWPLTLETPKPLLDVAGKEIITRIIEQIEKIDEISEIIISTNAKFENKFNEYMKKAHKIFSKKLKLVIEPTMEEDKKLGSVGGLNFLIDHIKLDKDVLIIGGDNLFEFDLAKFIGYFKEKKSSAIALRKVEDKELIKQYGVAVINSEKKIVEFSEKSQQPKSDLASTACYMFTHRDAMLVKKYLAEGNSPDAMGSFVIWLIKNTSVYGYVFSEQWFDIGSFEGLDEARGIYSKIDLKKAA